MVTAHVILTFKLFQNFYLKFYIFCSSSNALNVKMVTSLLHSVVYFLSFTYLLFQTQFINSAYILNPNGSLKSIYQYM